MPRCNSFENRVTIFLGNNVAGYKLKPFVIWHRANPSASRNISLNTLSVYYRSSKKPWMTQVLQYALLNCYASKMQKYSLEKDTHFKILLNVDNTRGHPPFIGNLYPNIKVVFLFPNTLSLIQPIDQEVTAAFKASFLRRTYAQVIAATEEDTDAVLEGLHL